MSQNWHFPSPLLSFLLLTWVYVLSQLLGYLLPTSWEDVVCYAFMAHQFLILCLKFHPSYPSMCWGTVNLSFLNWIISIISNVETDVSWNDCKHDELILKVSKSQKEILGYSHTPRKQRSFVQFLPSLLKGAKSKNKRPWGTTVFLGAVVENDCQSSEIILVWGGLVRVLLCAILRNKKLWWLLWLLRKP